MSQADCAATSYPVDKDYFYIRLGEFYSEQKNKHKKPWSLQRHSEVIQIINASRQASANKKKRTNEQYYFGNHYEVIEVGGVKEVIKKRKNEGDPLIFLVPYENIYDKLVDCHESTGHGGRDKMKSALSHKFSINRTCIEVFLKCCKRCTENKSLSRRGYVANKIWNHRGKVDLIDFQSTPEGEFKWLLNYQDHLTKFIHLRPLKSKNVEEVSLELLKIFMEFGAPQILHSDVGRDFVNAIIKDFVLKWPACKIINGSEHVDLSTSNHDVEDLLRCWLKDNKTGNWSLGCFYVQWLKNSSYNKALGRSPYKTLFGRDFKLGLNSTNLPNELIKSISTEEELYEVLENRRVLQEIQYLKGNSSSINEYDSINVKQELSEAPLTLTESDPIEGIEEVDLPEYVEDSCVKNECIEISEVKLEFVDPDNNMDSMKSEDILEISTCKNMDITSEVAKKNRPSKKPKIE